MGIKAMVVSMKRNTVRNMKSTLKRNTRRNRKLQVIKTAKRATIQIVVMRVRGQIPLTLQIMKIK